MAAFKNILVDIDAMAAAHPAMDRAAELARACGATLKIVDVLAVPSDASAYLPPGAEDHFAKSRRDRLAEKAAAVALKGITTEINLLRGRPAIALIQEVQRSGHDLVIRSHARDLAARRAFGAIDMELFRQCPCAVWAVGPGTVTAPRRVLAAVHANPEDPEEHALNGKIIETARLIAELGQAPLVIFQAWTAFGEELLRSHAKPEEVGAYAEAAEQGARERLDALVRSSGGPGLARVELQKGDPEDVIPRFVVAEGIDLVVMGTVARKGIAGLLIGNTAERLLQRLVCSVLAVKPDGFVSPVRLDA